MREPAEEVSALQILAFDSSGPMGAVALLNEEGVLASRQLFGQKSHSQRILPMAKEILIETGVSLGQLDALAVAIGPGSYTGLRIGIGVVMGLALGANLPCAGVSTLEALAYNAAPFTGKSVCTAIKARLNLVYAGIFTQTKKGLERAAPDRLIEIEALAEELSAFSSLTVTGDGAESLREFCRKTTRIMPPHYRLQNAVGVGLAALSKGDFQPPDALKPQYL